MKITLCANCRFYHPSVAMTGWGHCPEVEKGVVVVSTMVPVCGEDDDEPLDRWQVTRMYVRKDFGCVRGRDREIGK